VDGCLVGKPAQVMKELHEGGEQGRRSGEGGKKGRNSSSMIHKTMCKNAEEGREGGGKHTRSKSQQKQIVVKLCE